MFGKLLFQRSHNLFSKFNNKVNRMGFHTSCKLLRGEDLYNVLGVDRGSSQGDIKKAYYKLAQQYHPDKNPSADAKVKFTNVREAYDTIGDEQKRKMYDATGMKDGEQGQGQDPFSGFGGQGFGGKRQGFDEEIFDDFASFFNMDGQQRGRTSKGADIILNMEVSFMESINGVKKEIQFEKRGICKTCNGSKCRPGTAPTKCGGCGGRGTVNFRQGPMTIQMQCSKCKGAGMAIKSPCTSCRGSGVGNQRVTEHVQVPKGISTGQNLRVQAKGSESESGGSQGDLILKVVVQDDPYFKRDNYDVITDHHLTISQAVLGYQATIKTLYGERSINVQPGTQHGAKYRLSGQGITKLAPHHDQRGDQIVFIKVQIPNNLNPAQKELFNKLDSVETKIDPKMNLKTSDEHVQQKQKTQGGRNKQREEQDDGDIFNQFKNMFR